MRNAKMIAAASIAMSLLVGCRDKAQSGQENNIAIEGPVPSNQLAGNADIETLPPDESSTTPSNQLANGFDNPDVNDLADSNSQ